MLPYHLELIRVKSSKSIQGLPNIAAFLLVASNVKRDEHDGTNRDLLDNKTIMMRIILMIVVLIRVRVDSSKCL